MGICAQKPGHEDAFYNNTCILTEAGGSYASFSTAPNSGGVAQPAMPIMHDNRVFTPDGTAKEVTAPLKLASCHWKFLLIK